MFQQPRDDAAVALQHPINKLPPRPQWRTHATDQQPHRRCRKRPKCSKNHQNHAFILAPKPSPDQKPRRIRHPFPATFSSISIVSSPISCTCTSHSPTPPPTPTHPIPAPP